jgi:hypothetical protein
MYLGYCQLVYPWIGIARSLRYRVERRRMIYLHPDARANAEATVPLEVPSAASVMDGAIVAPSAITEITEITETNAAALSR